MSPSRTLAMQAREIYWQIECNVWQSVKWIPWKIWTGKSNKFSYALQKKHPELDTVLKRLALFLHCLGPGQSSVEIQKIMPLSGDSFFISLLPLLNRTHWLWYCTSLSSSSPCPLKSAVDTSFPCSCFACCLTCLTVFCIIWKTMSPPMILLGFHPPKTKV